MEKEIVIISGGTSGIGLATAKIIASEGKCPILLGRDEVRGEQAMKMVPGSRYISCDVTSENSLQTAIKKGCYLRKNYRCCSLCRPVYRRLIGRQYR